MNIQQILQNNNLESRFDSLLDYVGEVCGQPCGIMNHLDVKKAEQSARELEVSALSVFISHHSNNHTVAVGPAVRFTLRGNKFGWCLSLDIQLASGRLEFVETLWCNIEKLQDFGEHIRNFMSSDGEIDSGFAIFLTQYFGRRPDVYSAY